MAHKIRKSRNRRGAYVGKIRGIGSFRKKMGHIGGKLKHLFKSGRRHVIKHTPVSYF